MLKKICVALLIIVVVIVGAGYYFWSNLDSYLKVAIEKYGTAATQASVTVHTVSLSLISGTGSISGLNVGAPPGFSAPQSFDLGSIAVQLDTSSIAGNGPIVIREIDIDAPQVTEEINASGDSNLKAIERNTTTYAAAMTGPAGDTNTPPESSSAGGSGRKMIISEFYIRNGRVDVDASVLRGKSLNVPLPTIHLTNIGQASGGATAAEVARAILGSISAAAIKAGSSALNQLVMDRVKLPSTGGAGSAIKGLFSP